LFISINGKGIEKIAFLSDTDSNSILEAMPRIIGL